MKHFDPTTFDLDKLFHSRGMFDTAKNWERSGFHIVRAHETRMLVASHPSVPGILFKKYPTKAHKTPLEQRQNYERRIEGSRRIKTVITERRLGRVIVPQKWLVQLPSRFDSSEQPSYILAAERCKIVDPVRSRILYQNIDEATLREIIPVLFHFGGGDSSAKNVPFTKDGKLAFIDTDRWNDPEREKLKKRTYMKYLGKHLSNDRLKFAWRLWDDLL